MNILLLGEYSSLYSNLKDGLEELGHNAVIASYGDGWKNISRDIDLGGGEVDFFSKVKRKISPVIKCKSLQGFDVVQYINPFYFYHSLLPNKIIIDNIIKRNRKFFISAAGDDAFFWRNGREMLRYGPFDDFLKYDIRKKDFFMSKEKSYKFNEWLVERSDGVIPIMYEYELSYKGSPKLLKTIPIPMNLSKINYKENIPRDKLTVFHGLNRYGFKGTRHVEEAFKILAGRYPNDLELIIEGKLPLNQYLEIMKRANLVIDQTYSYSLGMNGVYALAMGKVVLGGAEPESLLSFGVEHSPVVNIEPSSSSIVKAVERLLQEKKRIPEIGFSSRKFAENNHCHVDIASKYISTWSEI